METLQEYRTGIDGKIKSRWEYCEMMRGGGGGVFNSEHDGSRRFGNYSLTVRSEAKYKQLHYGSKMTLETVCLRPEVT